MRADVDESEALMVLQGLNEAVLFFLSCGEPVNLPGVGTFIPSIDRAGALQINFRADNGRKDAADAPAGGSHPDPPPQSGAGSDFLPASGAARAPSAGGD